MCHRHIIAVNEARVVAVPAVPRLCREDYFCTICGYNALSPLHLEIHIGEIH
ncbi:hypothetical protein LPJ66_007711, partial [Kickxella alabastrina]